MLDLVIIIVIITIIIMFYHSVSIEFFIIIIISFFFQLESTNKTEREREKRGREGERERERERERESRLQDIVSTFTPTKGKYLTISTSGLTFVNGMIPGTKGKDICIHITVRFSDNCMTGRSPNI